MRCVWFAILIFILSADAISAATNAPSLNDESADNQADTITSQGMNIFEKVIKYFDDSNKPKSNKKVDFSVIGGPAYSSDTELSLGLIGAALYTAGNDTVTSQSNASLYTEVSITGYYKIGIRGVHFTPADKWRFNYKVSFSSMPTYYWGIGYDMAHNDDNKTDYLQLNAEIKASFDYRLFKDCYLGPAIDFNYTKATDADDYALWGDERVKTLSYGVGFNLYYDTRDCLTAPHQGWYLAAEQRFYPRFIGNKSAFSSTDFTASHYFGAWRDAIIAVNLHGLFSYGNTPWSMLAKVGGSRTMRGYYEGRYRDKNAIDATVELRQHIWRRNSAVVWVGAGNIFSRFSEIHSSEILPNFGIGYRWEFKKNVNIRLDVGFGKGEKGVVFNINEAF